jgi:hypothetical protein
VILDEDKSDVKFYYEFYYESFYYESSEKLLQALLITQISKMITQIFMMSLRLN